MKECAPPVKPEDIKAAWTHMQNNPRFELSSPTMGGSTTFQFDRDGFATGRRTTKDNNLTITLNLRTPMTYPNAPDFYQVTLHEDLSKPEEPPAVTLLVPVGKIQRLYQYLPPQKTPGPANGEYDQPALDAETAHDIRHAVSKLTPKS